MVSFLGLSRSAIGWFERDLMHSNKLSTAYMYFEGGPHIEVAALLGARLFQSSLCSVASRLCATRPCCYHSNGEEDRIGKAGENPRTDTRAEPRQL